MKQHLKLFSFISVLLFAWGCNNFPQKDSYAYFDYFTYKGCDSFYINNSLPDVSSFYNPILPGWNSDPSVCFDGRNYYLVTSTFAFYPGVPIYKSKDMLNFKQVNFALRDNYKQNLKGQRVNGGIYAATIRYNPANKYYYIITTDVGNGNFVVKTDNPEGKWSDPIFLPSVTGIDPSLFFDDDNKAYVVNNGDPLKSEYEGHKAIWIQQYDVNGDSMTGPRKILVDKGVCGADKPIWIEGPHMYKINGKYYLMCAEGGTGDNHSEVLFESDSPMGDYKPCKQNPILTRRHADKNCKNPVTCAGHADLVYHQNGNIYAVFLGCRPVAGKFENLGRETFMLPLKFNKDKQPYILDQSEDFPLISKVEGAHRDSCVTFGNYFSRCDFDSLPDMSWLNLRQPLDSLVSVTRQPGFLALMCSAFPATEAFTPAFLGKRLCHSAFEIETSLSFNPPSSDYAAGLLMFKDQNHQYFLCLKNNNNIKNVILTQVKDNQIVELASKPLDDDNSPVKLKIASKDGLCFDFSFSQDEKYTTLISGVDASYLSTAVAGGFTGTVVGPYAVVY